MTATAIDPRQLAATTELAALDDAGRATLAAAFEHVAVGAGDVLFERRSPREALLLVLHGSVALIDSARGQSHTLAICGPATLLGEAMLFGEEHHSLSCVATMDGAVGKLTREALATLRRDHPGVFADLAVACGRLLGHRLALASQGTRGLGKSNMMLGEMRVEHDLLGDHEVPVDALWGVQTQRAVDNFDISRVRLDHFPSLIEALVLLKRCCAVVNHEIGKLDKRRRDAIVAACDEIYAGRWHGHFVVDMVQGGAGTSTNMNANEVIANRALELLGEARGAYDVLHPNTHVNMSQSTNDIYPSAIKLALLKGTRRLVSEIESLATSFERKGVEFAGVIKMGRTQLQDAVPMTLGQEFSAWAETIREGADRIRHAYGSLSQLNVGGTAIGTGINTDPRYAGRVIEEINKRSDFEVSLAANLVEETQDTSGFVELGGVFKMMAVRLSKICNDLRLLSSGPRCGLREINLPPMQPGSSIMPGKVNPVIPEVFNQVAFLVIGNDMTITIAAEAGQLELNVFEPVIALQLLSSIGMMRRAMETLRKRCIDGITANAEHCRQMVLGSIGIVTALNPVLGYQQTSALAKEALRTDRSVYELVLERELLSKERLDELLSPESMISPT